MRLCLAGKFPRNAASIGGGVEYAVYVLASTLAEREDVELHVVSPDRGLRGVDVVEAPGMTVHRVGPPAVKLLPHMVTYVDRIAPVIAGIQPDIVVSHLSTTTLAALRAGCRTIHTLHGIVHKEVPYAGGVRKLGVMLNGLMEKRAAGMAQAVVGVGQYALDEYSRWIRGRRYLMYLPIEDLFWGVPALKSSSSFFFAGAVGPRKNLMVAVRAMSDVVRRCPDATLHVCGGVADKDYMRAVQRQIKADGTSEAIVFHGLVDRRTMCELMESSVALVLPSFQETTPVVICQTMAAGRVVVASPVGGIPGMVDDGTTGFLVDAKDSGALAERLIELVGNTEKARAMGSAARDVAASRYERRIVVEHLLDICSREIAASSV